MASSITILGAGYVGLTTATLLAHAGYTVYIVEPNLERLDVIRRGRSFFYEEGLDELIKLALNANSLIPTDSYEHSVPRSSVVFSCVGTPDNPDGSSNLSYVFAAAEATAKLAEPDTVYVQKSTVPVGTGRKVQSLFEESGAKLTYVSNPEFLREGTAVYDTLYFDRVVVGGDDKQSVDTVMDIYMDLEQFRDHIAHLAKISVGPRGDQYIATALNSAELIKVTSNAFLALKISFANSIAQLADKADADVVEVMSAVGADNRIGRAFLNAGRGYGGGCFPKDVSGLISSAHQYGVDLDIMQATQRVNDSMPSYVITRLRSALENLEGVCIAVLGLAFKAGTSDVRRSPGVAIANLLADAGARVRVYDHEAGGEAYAELNNSIATSDSIDEAIDDAHAVVIATEWSNILEYEPTQFLAKMSGNIVVDAVNQYTKEAAVAAGMTYIGIGRGISQGAPE